MPIDLNTYKPIKDYVLVEATETVGSVYAKLPRDKREQQAFAYIVAPITAESYFVARWVEIEEIARRLAAGVVRGTKLIDIVNLTGGKDTPAPDSYAKLRDYRFADLLRLLRPVEAVERSAVSSQDAREIRDSHPAKRLVVLEGGAILGLLTVEMLSGDTLGGDPFARGKANLTLEESSSDLGAKTAAVGSDAGPVPVKDRVFNYWIELLDEQGSAKPLTTSTPLQLGSVYELKINLAKPRKDAVFQGSADNLDSAEAGLAPEVEFYDVTIILETSDFTLYGTKEQILTIWRGSYSKNTATFSFEPAKAGIGKATAFFLIDGSCFQQVEFELTVGGRAAKSALSIKQTRGKTVTSAMASFGSKKLEEAPVNLMILKDPAAYRFILSGAGVTRATLNLSEVQIAQFIDRARAELLKIVNLEHQGDYVYQSEVLEIPKEIHEASLKQLANIGSVLYDRMFYRTGPDAKAMGDLLKKISQERSLHIQIIAERFIFPWGLLYDGDPRAATIDPQGFWGFKHVIEYIPEFSIATPVNFIPEMRTTGNKLGFVFVCNTEIDTELTNANYPPVIAPQIDYFGKLSTISFQKRSTRDEFLQLLQDENAPAFIYINCHAISKQPNEQGGTYSSKIKLSDGEISLDDLDFDAPVLPNGLKNGPVVFLNACQSAELSPYLYAGLVPAMIQRGARGVLGTEVDTPSQFAAAFAQEFITRFSKGRQPLGDLLLDMRREYLEQKNNIMGLLYALYSSGDLVVVHGK
jgi:hypothetical protein